MRHADVAYFDDDGRPVDPRTVALSPEGVRQAEAAREALAGARIDRVLTSGLPRTVETARIVAPQHTPEEWPDFRELEGGRLADIPEDELERTFTRAFDGVVALDRRFLGGETIGSLFDRVLPAFERLLADTTWDTVLAVLHGAVNRAIVSYALTGERLVGGGVEQAPACVNILDVGDGFVVRALNHTPYDPLHASGRWTTMERLFAQYRPRPPSERKP